MSKKEFLDCIRLMSPWTAPAILEKNHQILFIIKSDPYPNILLCVWVAVPLPVALVVGCMWLCVWVVQLCIAFCLGRTKFVIFSTKTVPNCTKSTIEKNKRIEIGSC